MARAGSCPRFVGRDAELSALLDATADVGLRGSTTILVSGDAGTGKSRLIEEFVISARREGIPVAVGASAPVDGAGVPYGAVSGAIRDLARSAEGRQLLDVEPSSPAGQALAFLAPSAFGGAPRAGHVPTKAALLDGLLFALASATRSGPLVVVLEDLHWADSATVATLDFVTRNLTDETVVVVGTFRPDDLPHGDARRALLVELGRHERVRSIPLTPLGPGAVAVMAAAITGTEQPPHRVSELYQRSQGVPLFVEELLASGGGLPPELRQLVLLRTESLSKPATEVLRAASVLGTTVEHDLLRAVSETDDDSLDEAVAELIEARVLRSEGSHYLFRHALLQEAVYAELRPGERRRLHRRAGVAIENGADSSSAPSPDQRAVALATHWWHACEWERAVPALLAAASSAEAVLANAEALTHLERALEAVARAGGSAASFDLSEIAILERACEAAQWAERGARAVELATIGVERARSSGDEALIAAWLARLGRALFNEGDARRALAAFEEAADLLPSGLASRERARVVAEAARLLMMLSQYREAEARATDALAVAREVGARLEEGHALTTVGCCRFGLGFIDEGIACVREALDIALELGNPEALHRAFGNLAGMTLNAGRLEESAAIVQQGLRMTRDVDGAWMGTAATNGARALVRLGRWRDAEDLLEGFPGGTLHSSGCAHQSLAAVNIRRGEFAEAAASLAIADERSAGLSDVLVRGWYHTVAAELALEEDRPADAYAEIEAALALEASTDDDSLGPEMRALGIRALVDGLARSRSRRIRPDPEPEKVRLLCNQLLDAAAAEVAAPVARGGRPQPEAEAFALQCSAEASRLDRSDPSLWRAAADRWNALGQPYHRAYCEWREAEALLDARSDRKRAVEVLSSAQRSCAELGAGPLLERIVRLAQRAGVALVELEPCPVDGDARIAHDLGVTPRELEVLRCLAQGRSDRQIADELFISKKTASVHVSNLLRKLGASSRLEAGEIGQRAGLG